MNQKKIGSWLQSHWAVFASLGIIVLASVIFALRYSAAFTMPNFYAEDGSVFLKNILDHGVLGATLTAFNGYLVAGQYLVIDAAYIVHMLGFSFTDLPRLIAVASCVFLGITVSLPFILFRREMGWVVALATSMVLAFTPLPGSDFAIIGTIGNLKFAFMFWAVLLVIYRNIHYKNTKKVILIDVLLLLCVLTNGPVVALLPLALWPYRNNITKMIKRRKVELKFVKRPDVISVLVLAFISALYLAVVYVKGIPVLENYLNGPYDFAATDNIIYRVTMYSWFYPLSQFHEFIMSLPRSLIGIISIGLLAALSFWVYFISKRGRLVFSFGLYAIAISTIAFVATRPGIGNHMLEYLKFPDQFFYTQSLIFVFITFWVIAPYINSLRRNAIFVSGLLVVLVLSAPSGSSWSANAAIYQQRGDIYKNTAEACKSRSEDVTIPTYPSEIWNLSVNRDVACG